MNWEMRKSSVTVVRPLEFSSAVLIVTKLLFLSIIVDARLPDRKRFMVASGRFNSEPKFNQFNGERVNQDHDLLSLKDDKVVLRHTVQEEATHNGDVRKLPRTFLRGNDNSNGRELSSQLTGCCYNYVDFTAEEMCGMYGHDCESGEGGDDKDEEDGEDCSQAGLSFIGISFSVQTSHGNPYSYHLCDQFPMENIIDRSYDYVMSMDEDGWLIGGGYKPFDYSGKMPYVDSSHTELLRIGSLDPNMGGTSFDQVYSAMSSISFPPFHVFPEYLKIGGGHHSGDGDDQQTVPSSDITLVVSIVEQYDDDQSYSEYEQFLDDLFDAMDSVGGGPCMDDHDTDPHVSMARGVKFKSSYHQQQYMYSANLEVAVWQAMYPDGVVIGSSSYASFPLKGNNKREYVGYGNLYFFFDRANITKAFNPSRSLSESEEYYSTLYKDGGSDDFYASITEIDIDYSGSGDNDEEWEHNPYSWNANMAKHDMTDGWDLPPNCEQEGETFFGIPLSRKSDSNLQSTSTFQEQFDFETLIDRNFTYIKEFGTNHGWLIGEQIGNGAGSIVDKDTAHIPLFYVGTTNPNMGGISLSSLIKIGKQIDFGTLYIKPSFVFIDNDGHIKLQFEADATSALGYLYDNLCKMLGISWNYEVPSNPLNEYTACSMHAAGDRATYGCGPDNQNSGGFCPQMTIAYKVKFQSEDHAAAYLANCNSYVDYWRSLYPSGVAVGSGSFCKNGGCLGLFLNRYDLYYVFQPDLAGSWVEYNGASSAPTYSPAPTWTGGCSDPHNFHLDRCYRSRAKRSPYAVAWESISLIGQFSIFLLIFMSSTLALSVFFVRANRRRKDGESYWRFFLRDITKKRRRKRRKIKRVRRDSRMPQELQQGMLHQSMEREIHHSRSRSIRRKEEGRTRSHKSPSRNSASRSPYRSNSHRGNSRRPPRSDSKPPKNPSNLGEDEIDVFEPDDSSLAPEPGKVARTKSRRIA